MIICLKLLIFSYLFFPFNDIFDTFYQHRMYCYKKQKQELQQQQQQQQQQNSDSLTKLDPRPTVTGQRTTLHLTVTPPTSINDALNDNQSTTEPLLMYRLLMYVYQCINLWHTQYDHFIISTVTAIAASSFDNIDFPRFNNALNKVIFDNVIMIGLATNVHALMAILKDANFLLTRLEFSQQSSFFALW